MSAQSGMCACINPRCAQAGRCLGAPGGERETRWLMEENGIVGPDVFLAPPPDDPPMHERDRLAVRRLILAADVYVAADALWAAVPNDEHERLRVLAMGALHAAYQRLRGAA